MLVLPTKLFFVALANYRSPILRTQSSPALQKLHTAITSSRETSLTLPTRLSLLSHRLPFCRCSLNREPGWGIGSGFPTTSISTTFSHSVEFPTLRQSGQSWKKPLAIFAPASPASSLVFPL